MVAPTPTNRNLGVTLYSQLSLTTNITATTRSCRFMLQNIRRIRPLLTQKAAQVLVQALVIKHLDYCNSLLAGLPAGALQLLQLIQNAAARLVFNLPKFTHTTLLPSLVTSGCPHPFQETNHLHEFNMERFWKRFLKDFDIRVSAVTPVLAYRAANGSGPVYIQDTVKPYTPARPLCSASANWLAAPSLRTNHSTKSQLLAQTV